MNNCYYGFIYGVGRDAHKKIWKLFLKINLKKQTDCSGNQHGVILCRIKYSEYSSITNSQAIGASGPLTWDISLGKGPLSFSGVLISGITQSLFLLFRPPLDFGKCRMGTDGMVSLWKNMHIVSSYNATDTRQCQWMNICIFYFWNIYKLWKMLQKAEKHSLRILLR